MQSLFNVFQQLIDLLSLALFRKDDKAEVVQLNTVIHSHTFKTTESLLEVNYSSIVMKHEKESPCPGVPPRK